MPSAPSENRPETGALINTKVEKLFMRKIFCFLNNFLLLLTLVPVGVFVEEFYAKHNFVVKQRNVIFKN